MPKKHYTLNLDTETVELCRTWAEREGRNLSNLVNFVMANAAAEALRGKQLDIENHTKQKGKSNARNPKTRK